MKNKKKIKKPKYLKVVKGNCGGNKRGCEITLLPYFELKKAA